MTGRGLDGAAAPGLRQSLGKLDDGTMREAGEHHVLDLGKLRCQRGIDASIRMAEQVHPPRADRIEIAAAVVVVEP